MGADSEGNAELDFEQAQFENSARGEVTCRLCGKPPGGAYFSLNGSSVCTACLETQRAAQKGSFFKALALGTVAGLAGALVYYGITELTGYNLALITIVLGIMVGLAVRRGAGGSRSIAYRLMAVALAWCAMSLTYAPGIAAGLMADSSDEASAQDGGDRATLSGNGAVVPASDAASAAAAEPTSVGPGIWIFSADRAHHPLPADRGG